MIYWLTGLLAAVILAVLLALWALRPRRGQPGWEALAAYRYAHRGLHDVSAGRPENSLSAFRAAAEAGFGAELDVHLLADGSLAVVHDRVLERVCGRPGVIEDLRREDLADYPLLGSGESIPLLEDVLTVFRGRGPLIIELKATQGNAAALTDAVLERLAGWQGAYCLESFYPAVLAYLRKKRPDVLRGQLSQDFLHGDERTGRGRLADWAMTHLLVCAAGRPDFVAYRWQDRREPALGLMRRLWGVPVAYWTVRSPETMKMLESEGAAVIFEGFAPDEIGPAGDSR